MNKMIEWPGNEWQTVRLIGKGGFGEVYEIQREEFGKIYKAAMKVMRIPSDESEIASMLDEGMTRKELSYYYKTYTIELSKEFSLLADLKGYTNIVSYEDHKILQDPDGIRWTILIRMELLTPVKTYLRQHPADEETVRRLGMNLCTALNICHEKGIIHRDIKLENIFVNERGDFELGDFGVARVSRYTTSSMTVVGTTDYMAPEVLRGERYGQAADLYSLGIVLYRMLNQMRGPFYPTEGMITPQDREKASYARRSGKKIPEPLHGSPQLKEAVLKALSFKPEDRFPDAEEFRRALAGADLQAAGKAERYEKAMALFANARTRLDYEKAEAAFESLGDYKNSKGYLLKCRAAAEQVAKAESPKNEKKKKSGIFGAFARIFGSSAETDPEKTVKSDENLYHEPIVEPDPYDEDLTEPASFENGYFGGAAEPACEPDPYDEDLTEPASFEKSHKEAEPGPAEAYQLAENYRNGSNGFIQNDDEAIKYYQIAARDSVQNPHYGDACFYLGWIYAEKKEDFVQAAVWYERAAAAGDVYAMNNLAVQYANGKGVEKNGTKAIGFYTYAAEKGHGRAANNLGMIYEYGQCGQKPDPAKALKWYEKAAELKIGEAEGNADRVRNQQKVMDPEQAFKTANNYRDGRNGCPQDYDQALKYYLIAAKDESSRNKKYSEACLSAAILYEEEKQDYAQAEVWYQKAVAAGNTIAMDFLAENYQDGGKFEKNEAKAVTLYTRAAEAGSGSAAFKLGRIFETGTCGQVKDTWKALRWYQKAEKVHFPGGADGVNRMKGALSK